MERAGVSRERFLAAAQLDPAVLAPPEGRLTRTEIVSSFEVAFDITEDPALGIHWGEWITAASYALISQLAAQAETYRQALATILQFSKLISDEFPISLVERDEEAELRFGGVSFGSPRVQRLACELATLGFYRMFRDLTPGGKVLRVCFAYPAPSYRDEYTRVFDGVERSERTFAAPPTLGRRPVVHDDRERGLRDRRQALARRHPVDDSRGFVRDGLCRRQLVSSRVQALDWNDADEV